MAPPSAEVAEPEDPEDLEDLEDLPEPEEAAVAPPSAEVAEPEDPEDLEDLEDLPEPEDFDTTAGGAGGGGPGVGALVGFSVQVPGASPPEVPGSAGATHAPAAVVVTGVQGAGLQAPP